MVRAHPRACGENIHDSLTRTRTRGSSPRVRGKQFFHPILIVSTGLIPARAGKTTHWCGRWTRCSAHPRACGENEIARAEDVNGNGSSPRVRGKPVELDRVSRADRLIPARAGKTTRDPSSRSGLWAHPRACGENWANAGKTVPFEGSSPRVRGKRGRGREGRRLRGLIPARAGKTYENKTGQPITAAHPRACGENTLTTWPATGSSGSSPRVRGKRNHLAGQAPDAGLIPARAGKTRRRPRPGCSTRAHPRACGENTATPPPWLFDSGSSPRVRGKPSPSTTLRYILGLIPARAGKTGTRSPSPRASPAHPRACGENITRTIEIPVAFGSSPRVRGKPHRLR